MISVEPSFTPVITPLFETRAMSVSFDVHLTGGPVVMASLFALLNVATTGADEPMDTCTARRNNGEVRLIATAHPEERRNTSRQTSGGSQVGMSARCTNCPTTAFGGSDAPAASSDFAVTVKLRTSAVPIGRRRAVVLSGMSSDAPGSSASSFVLSEYPSDCSSSVVLNVYFAGEFP